MTFALLGVMDDARLIQDVPEVSPCFEESVLVWVPYGYMWVVLGPYLLYIAHGDRTTPLPWTPLQVAKSCVSGLLFCILLAAVSVTTTSGYRCVLTPEVPHVYYLAIALLVLLLEHYMRINGVKTSGIIFMFWFLAAVCGLLPLYSMATAKDNPCPEENALVVKAYKETLSANDLWDQTTRLRSGRLVPAFLKCWKQSEKRLTQKRKIIEIIDNRDNPGAYYPINYLLVLSFTLTRSVHYLDAQTAFVVLSLVNILRSPIVLTPFVVNGVMQGYVSFSRVQAFLWKEDVKEDTVEYTTKGDHVVNVENASFSWTEVDRRPTLNNINLNVDKGEIIAVVGQVGSGKSSLISAILGEMEKRAGHVAIQGKVAYVPQEAWIQNMTVRDNILFGHQWDEVRYSKVLNGCALLQDLEILSGGDMTEIDVKQALDQSGQPITKSGKSPVKRRHRKSTEREKSLGMSFSKDTALKGSELKNEGVSRLTQEEQSQKGSKFYLPTARQVKRMESVLRSPIYNHFSESISGASVIRAYRCMDRFIKESERRVDKNAKFYFAALSAGRWIAVRLETLGNFLILAAAIFALLSDLNGAQVGLSVTYSLQITISLNLVIQAISELEMNIVSAERVSEYTELISEAPWSIPARRPSREWPRTGDIELKMYRTRYREGLELTLKGLNCHIQSAEKIGIVGRTGAGKSSLALSLFRLIEAAGGSIVIDGRNIANMGLHDLRDKLTILPQDPVLFSGSLRENLDPFGRFDDPALWKALECAHLKESVDAMHGQLDYECGEGGSNLSVGQRQLVCLARTLLHKTRILILDEATAAVDLETDELIQETIRREFSECTVLTIAHRLNTVIDYDRVMVLSEGEIVEMDKPGNLLQDANSAFYKMAKDAGIV
ncbi:MRP1-like protein [Mya arenaria]|uniref:MRP1-like protein n=1 Tax=Mya arenaria TaxID=6604 RepID=A0ABY7FI66_MYAAR|nr:MRP1-like protein [Mya arenaria]